MRLISCKLIEVANLSDQARRTFDWNTDGGFIKDIEDVVSTNGGRITSRSFDAIAGDVLTMSTRSERVNAPGIGSNWDELRFRFVIEIELEPETKYSKRSERAIVRGYTDHADLSHRDTVSGATKMYINSVATLVDTRDKTGRRKTRIVDTSQTLLGRLDDDLVLVRPSDIFGQIDAQSEMSGMGLDEDEIVDTRSTFTNGIQLNSREHNYSGSYLRSLISADLSAASNLETLNDNLIDETRDVLAQDALTANAIPRKNKFLRAMMESDRNFKFNNHFTYRDLAAFTDGSMRVLDDMTRITKVKSFTNFESDNLASASATVVAAAEICHQLPGIIERNYFDSLSFTADNYDVRNGPGCHIFIDEFSSLLGDNISNPEMLFDNVENSIEMEVFNKVSNRGGMEVKMSVDCDISGVTIVDLTIEGETTRCTFASFGDALIAPVLTDDSGKSLDLADGYSDVRKTIDSTINAMRELDLHSTPQDVLKERRRAKENQRRHDSERSERSSGRRTRREESSRLRHSRGSRDNRRQFKPLEDL